MRFVFEADVWLWPGDAAWHFITVPSDVSEEVRDLQEGPRRGFGAVKVAVTIGSTSWKTSLFPDSKSGCYLLPVKKAVRQAENAAAGETVSITLDLVAV